MGAGRCVALLGVPPRLSTAGSGDCGDNGARRKSHLLVSEADRPKTISHDILGFRKYCKDVRSYVHPCHEFHTYVCFCVFVCCAWPSPRWYVWASFLGWAPGGESLGCGSGLVLGSQRRFEGSGASWEPLGRPGGVPGGPGGVLGGAWELLEGPGAVLEGLGGLQGAPKTPQDPPKMAQNAPKTAPRGPKTRHPSILAQAFCSSFLFKPGYGVKHAVRH